MNRRDSLKVISSLPLVAAFPAMALGAEKVKTAAKKAADKKAPAKKGGLPLIDEKDTLASAMQYKHDAKKAGPMRSNKKANCKNCSKYNVCMDGDKACKPLTKKALATAEQAPCQIFNGKAVKAKGWCLSWSKV